MSAEALPEIGPEASRGERGGTSAVRGIAPRAMAGAFVAFSAGISLAVLALRNLYDDELLTLYLASGRVREILNVSAEGDVHPPGMYLLAHAGWLLTHSYRWLNLLPMAVLYAGLAVFLVSSVPLVRTRGAQSGLLLLATLHPELLMWSNTFRWYCPWTGLALVALTVALQPGKGHPALSATRAALLGLLMAGLFYLNYVTLLFAVAVGAAVVTRYRSIGWRALGRSFTIGGAVFAAVVLPQIGTMVTVHLASGHAQRYRLVASVLRLVQALGQSEAFLPWHPVAIVAFCGLGLLYGTGLAALQRVRKRVRVCADVGAPGLASLAGFCGVYLVLLALSGLGGKPRSGLLLIPVLAPIAAVGVERLGRRVQVGVFVLLALWAAVGTAHLLGRYGLIKAGMNDRPEEVVGLISYSLLQQRSGRPGESPCGVVVMYDSGLAFRLAQAKIPGIRSVSPYGGEVFGGSTGDLPEECAEPLLFVVESYIDGPPVYVDAYTRELHAAESFVGAAKVERFDADPEAPRKRRLARLAGSASGSRLPDYRYVVVWGTMERASYHALIRALPDYHGATQ